MVGFLMLSERRVVLAVNRGLPPEGWVGGGLTVLRHAPRWGCRATPQPIALSATG